MIKIEYPKHPFKIKKENNAELIFDAFRKRWVVLTPEEWVWQNILQYLTEIKKISCQINCDRKRDLAG